MTNSWPGGYRYAISQSAHARHNASHYPGTRQLCTLCDEPTGQCEEDAFYVVDRGPLCRPCFDKEEEL